MEQHIKANGGMTPLTAKANSLMLMVTFTKATLKTTKLTGLEYIHTVMAQFTKATGNSMPTMEKV